MTQTGTGAVAPQGTLGNRTGFEMLASIHDLDAVLGLEGLTTDATAAIAEARALELGRFTAGAEYAQVLVDQNPALQEPFAALNPLAGLAINGASAEVTPKSESLTPEEQAFKESLLSPEATHAAQATYETMLLVINKGRNTKNQLGFVSEADNRALAEAALTDAVVRELHAQLLETRADPKEHSPTAGFDVLFVINESLTPQDHNAVAQAIQDMVPAYSGRPDFYEPLHKTTNQKAGDLGTRIVIAPRHLTLEPGTVAAQKAVVDAHNADTDNTTTLVTTDVLGNMTAIAHTITTNPDQIDWTTPGQEIEARFWATCYRDIEAPIADGIAPRWYVDDDGQFFRGASYLISEGASRALVVPRV